MLTDEQVRHFQTFGFLQVRQFLSPTETDTVCAAFDAAMKKQRGGTEKPDLSQDAEGYSAKSQDVIPFFQLDPETFYPLLDDERIVGGLTQLFGPDFVYAMHSARSICSVQSVHHLCAIECVLYDLDFSAFCIF